MRPDHPSLALAQVFRHSRPGARLPFGRRGNLRAWRRQAGISLPTAIFVITVMAFLAVMINQLVAENARGFDEELNLVRAFYAAESGAQLGMNGLFPPPDGAGGSCPASASYSFTADGVKACSALVSCSSVTVDSSAYYTVESTGTCGEVSRTIQVRAQ